MPASLPALLRAYELSARAAAVGFDWATPGDVLDKIDEEVREVRAAASSRSRRAPSRTRSATCCLPSPTTRASSASSPRRRCAARRDKFQQRFTRMEQLARADGTTLASLSLDAQNALWDRVKAEGAGGAATDAAAR